ncbi:hypothetical protein Q763_02365 [Flavobacterium beibuense F44-8]|uniref:Uncharacterized protein n=1 Tax=Flavobacterium beibuense F44-8 TaxID=1406840 RepID=A0A0A2LVS7_9FLAO|nr:hypothetical protein [Flavobacterium beibuense]KGO83431.1 hypothetical protein Q763_02365 [Flavobacterium beibuense F44-8]
MKDMNLNLRFATSIIRPWERLNSELTNQISVDSDISDFITMAEDLAVRLSHFPEIAGRKSVRTNKNSQEYNVIVDIADATKHESLSNEERNNKLSISSQFEGRDDETFRFIRNKIVVEHSKYGNVDFLETSKKAAEFLFSQLGLNIFWKANILEAPIYFSNKVQLDIYYKHQFVWNGLQIEFLRKNESGELIHYNPPNFLFELRSHESIMATNFFEYVYELLKVSINQEYIISINPLARSNNSNNAEFTIKNNFKEEVIIVKLIPQDCATNIEYFKNVLKDLKFESLIIISKIDFSEDIKEYVCSLENVSLVIISNHEAVNIPIGFFKIKTTHSNLKLTSVNKIVLGVLKEDAELFSSLHNKPINSIGKKFSLDKVNLIDFEELCLSQVVIKNGKTKGKMSLNYKPRDKKDFFVKIDDKFIKIGVEVDFEWETENTELNSPILTFDKTQMGISFWYLESYITIEGKKNHIKIPAIKYGNTSAFGLL